MDGSIAKILCFYSLSLLVMQESLFQLLFCHQSEWFCGKIDERPLDFEGCQLRDTSGGEARNTG